jgi:hypothetical protein
MALGDNVCLFSSFDKIGATDQKVGFESERAELTRRTSTADLPAREDHVGAPTEARARTDYSLDP